MQLGTLIIAIYGAVLASWQQIRHYVEKKPRIHVRVSPGVMKIYSALEKIVALEAQNRGSIGVTFSSPPAFLLPKRNDSLQRKIIIRDPLDASFPCDLLPRKKVTVSMRACKLVQSLKEEGYSGTVSLTGLFVDDLDNSYTSKPFDFNIDFWGKPVTTEDKLPRL